MNIIDDFVKPRIQDDIEKMLLDSNFPYYRINESVYVDENNSDANVYSVGSTMTDANTLNVPQFFHTFIIDGNINSQFYNNISHISNKLVDCIDEDYYISRCKINLNTIDNRFENKYHTPHIDNPFEEQITAIYYVNDSDGDTFFFDDAGNITKRITPKKGRLVWWKGRIFHAKSSPLKTTSRLVLNFNLLPHGDIK